MNNTEDRVESSSFVAASSTSSDPDQPTMEKESVRKEDGTPHQSVQPGEEQKDKLLDLRTVLVLISVLSGAFLVALDRSIISTAIPAITDEFNSLSGYGWYGSAYLLTTCAFQLLFGKIYTFFDVKATFITSVVIFEAASALCGAAPTSTAFIIGRAIAGIGAAGIFAGSIVCIVYVVPLHIRPKVQGVFGAVFGCASIIGPLIGGALTTHATWRWCFYLNLPIGGVAMVVIAFLLKIPNRETTKLPLKQKLRQLDFPGTALFIPGVVSLLLALQWGGQKYDWNSWRIILLLAIASVLLIGFAAVQVWMPETATLAPRIFKQRTVLSSMLATFTISSAQYIFIYYLPTYFQSVQGVNSVESGIRLLPTMVPMIAASMFGGWLNSQVGYYTPSAIFGSSLMSVGAGLITTFWTNTSEGEWIGYQVLYGLGIGFCFMIPNLAVQACLPKNDAPIALSLMLFSNLFGSTIFVSVGENVLTNQLTSRLSGIPGFNRNMVTSSGATSIVETLPSQYRDEVLIAYNQSLRKVFQIALILCCISVIGCVTLEWKNVKKGKNNMATVEAAAEEDKRRSQTLNVDGEKGST